MHAALLVLALLAQPKPSENVRPQIGYVYPTGGQAGSTIDVMIGGYDWTPDVKLFVRNERVKIEITGPAGEIIMTPPPFWFGPKAGQLQPPLPREIPARITLPADLPPGPIHFQAYNANGASEVGTFEVGKTLEVIEPEKNRSPIDLPSLPIVASGRLARITEIDQYKFTATAAGLVTCKLDDRIGQAFAGVLTIRDAQGVVIADGADTTGRGVAVTFSAKAGAAYSVAVNDAEFAGDRGYVYRLSITSGPQLITTSPLVVARGKSTPLTVVGWGVATGAHKIETATTTVAVPANAGETYRAELKTPGGLVTANLAVAEVADAVESKDRKLAVPSQTTATFAQLDAATQMPVARFQIDMKKDEVRRLSVEATRFGSTVDPSIAIVAADGTEVIRNDDLLNTLDAAVDFKAPADGTYDVVVTDYSGEDPSPVNTYRLLVEDPETTFDFAIVAPDKFEIHLGAQADMVVKTSRRGAWEEAIELTVENLPDGVTTPPPPAPEPPAPPPVKGAKPVKKPVVRKGKVAPGDMKLTIIAAADTAAEAKPVIIVAKATVGDRTIEHRTEPVLLVKKLKPRCVIKSAVQDGGRLVNRGTTYPAEVIVERLEEYTGPVTLQMAATQSRQRRGMASPSFPVAAGVDRVLYPVTMPEWLETSLTARMTVIGVVETTDPKGNKHFVTGSMDGNIVMSLEGAIMKVTHEPQERRVPVGGKIALPVKVSRTVKCRSEAKIEIVPDEEFPELFTAETITLPDGQTAATIQVKVAAEPRAVGMRKIIIRSTALQDGKWPAVSETAIPVVIEAGETVASAK